MPQSNVFGSRIRQRLKELKKTQRWLANQTGIPEQTVSNIVNGRFENSGSITQAVPMAKAMSTTVDFLFGLTTSSEKPIYASAKVRRLATIAEMLLEPDLDRLILEAQRRMEASRKELWQAELTQKVQELVQRYGGDVEAALAALDKLTAPTAAEPSLSEAPSLFDERFDELTQ